jgi:thiamine kinase-like enzyme
MDDYNNLFPCTKMTLSHGDLHRGNLLRDYYITDWDNLSYKNKRIDIAYTVFIYLSDILHDNNYCENNWKVAIDNVERLYGTESLFDAYKLGSKKIIISVKESHISSFKKTVEKIFNSIS